MTSVPAHNETAEDAALSAALDHVRRVTRASGTSFFWAMRLLPAPRREAMFAIYAFCREVDDVADEEAPAADKVLRLEDWRAEIDRLYTGAPTFPTTRALARPVAEYGLEKADFLALIEGMEMDAGEAIRAPTMTALEYYCDRVACAVGRLSIRAFGATEPAAREVAYALGQALQLTNILRDPKEDAVRGRLYLPAELLDKHEIGTNDPMAVLAHPRLPDVCRDLAAVARRRFDEADAAIAQCARQPMRPAIVMKEIYSRYLDRLVAGGWRDLDDRVSLSRLQKLWIGLRHGLF
jgi:phytoene synthase